MSASNSFVGKQADRIHRLAYRLRQSAVRTGQDITGWKISRVMREANTPEQLADAELLYRNWKVHRHGSRTAVHLVSDYE